MALTGVPSSDTPRDTGDMWGIGGTHRSPKHFTRCFPKDIAPLAAHHLLQYVIKIINNFELKN